MPLRVVAGPGCDAVGKDEFVEDALAEPGDVVISVGRIFKALTGSSGVPSENPPALRLALGLRTVAIRSAREKELSGFILTSNGRPGRPGSVGRGNRARSGVTVMKLTEAQACARVAQLVPAGSRRLACEEGVKRRWFKRFQPSPTDREVTP